MFIYAFYNCTFNYNENLILRISPLLIIGLFEASYESSVLFHWMQWPLNLISRPVDVCFALQCSSSFINWRSKTLRILITPWHALLQFPCVCFPFVRTYWQILMLEHPQFLSRCSGQRVFVQTLKDGLWGQRVKTPHPGCWRCLYTTPLFIPVAAAVVSATATATRRRWSGPGPRPHRSQATQKIHVCVLGHGANCSVPGSWFISAANMPISIVP